MRILNKGSAQDGPARLDFETPSNPLGQGALPRALAQGIRRGFKISLNFKGIQQLLILI